MPHRLSTTRQKLLDWKLLAGIAVVGGMLVVSLMVGQYDILGNEDGTHMFWTTRVPRTIALVLSGMAMAMSGMVMQLLTQNKFVEPTTTGTTEWAGLGLLVALYFIPNSSLTVRMIVAVIFAFIGTMVFFLFLRKVTLKSSLVVPIIGIMLGAVISSISTFFAMKTDMLQSLGIWFAGSYTSIIRGQYEVLWTVGIVVVLVFIFADRLTIAGLGKDIAVNVGLNYERIVLLGVGLVAIASGVVTVVVGMLPFLGLIVPNMVSTVRGDDLRSNLPWVCLVGVAVVTICDIIGRTIIAPFEMPVSVILGIIGAIVFVSLIAKKVRA